jgi:hypothetical protein
MGYFENLSHIDAASLFTLGLLIVGVICIISMIRHRPGANCPKVVHSLYAQGHNVHDIRRMSERVRKMYEQAQIEQFNAHYGSEWDSGYANGNQLESAAQETWQDERPAGSIFTIGSDGSDLNYVDESLLPGYKQDYPLLPGYKQDYPLLPPGQENQDGIDVTEYFRKYRDADR